MRTRLLKTHLINLAWCPTCGAPRHVGSAIRFQCGAAFAVSNVTNTIVATSSCPRPSDLAAETLTETAMAANVAGAA